ncbi:MAG: sugar ABC transporter permease [Bacillota bacterium]
MANQKVGKPASTQERLKGYSLKQNIKNGAIGTFIYTWLAITFIIIMVPVLWMVSAAFTDTQNLNSVPIFPNPAEWSLANYIEIFTYKGSSGQFLADYPQAFLVSLGIATLSTVLTVIFSSLVGFAFSRYRFKGKKSVLLSMLGLQMFPSFMGMIALYLLFNQFGWLNSWPHLALIYVAGSIPFNTFIIRGFMKNIPLSLDESARIDGASNLQVLLKVIIPLATPILGFVAVDSFMKPWLDFILPSILMPNNETVAMWLFRVNDNESQPYNPMLFMAGGLFLAVPIMIVQIYMQKYVVYGLTVGAEKG